MRPPREQRLDANDKCRMLAQRDHRLLDIRVSFMIPFDGGTLGKAFGGQSLRWQAMEVVFESSVQVHRRCCAHKQGGCKGMHACIRWRGSIRRLDKNPPDTFGDHPP